MSDCLDREVGEWSARRAFPTAKGSLSPLMPATFQTHTEVVALQKRYSGFCRMSGSGTTVTGLGILAWLGNPGSPLFFPGFDVLFFRLV